MYSDVPCSFPMPSSVPAACSWGSASWAAAAAQVTLRSDCVPAASAGQQAQDPRSSEEGGRRERRDRNIDEVCVVDKEICGNVDVDGNVKHVESTMQIGKTRGVASPVGARDQGRERGVE
jgi:hypothetical protein